MEAQIVLFWYGILNKKNRVLSVGCHITSDYTIHFGECVSIIKMSMVEEWVVTLGFN